ncbi:MAG: hypothetical protein EXQ74_04615 [Thermoleophilia bacterium]|nr:hypothetical protein [Thermoleophilia bacterium]
MSPDNDRATRPSPCGVTVRYPSPTTACDGTGHTTPTTTGGNAGGRMARHIVVAIVVAGLIPPVALTAGGSASDLRTASRAVMWLATIRTSGLPASQQADIITALRVSGATVTSLSSRLAALARAAPAYADTAGGAAKVAIGVVAGGGNPARLGGTDYIARINRHLTRGRFGETAFDQALSMIALHTAGRSIPPAAVVLLRARTSGAGWSFALDPTDAPDVDSTAISVVALRAAGTPATNATIRTAMAWIASQRTAGGWSTTRGEAPSANTTALVARAEIATGRSPAVALRFIRGLQQPSGAIRYTRSVAENRVFATVDSVPPLMGVSLANGLRASHP